MALAACDVEAGEATSEVILIPPVDRDGIVPEAFLHLPADRFPPSSAVLIEFLLHYCRERESFPPLFFLLLPSLLLHLFSLNSKNGRR